MSNELKKIVKRIQFRTDKTIEEIAKDIGYARAYFTNQVNIGTNKTLKSLLEKYLLDYEQNVLPEFKTQDPSISHVSEDPAIYNTALPQGDFKVTLKDHIDFLKDTIKKAEEREQKLLMLLEKDILAIKANSETIIADLQQVSQMTRADDLSMMEGTDKILGRESGTTAIEAGIVEHALGEPDEDIDTKVSNHKQDNSGKGRQQGKA